MEIAEQFGKAGMDTFNGAPYGIELILDPESGSANEKLPEREHPEISIIIPAHNEEKYLGSTLEAIHGQSFQNFETIVAANNCSDRTVHFALPKSDQVFHLRQKGLSRARNLGAEIAKSELLIFLDADTALERDALEIISREFTRTSAVGTLKARPDPNRPAYQLLYFCKNFEHRFSLHKGSSGVIICWRDYFAAAGGFDESLHLCENSDLIHRLSRFGKYKYIASTFATTSMRRYEYAGMRQMALLWFNIWFSSLFGDIRHRNYETVR